MECLKQEINGVENESSISISPKVVEKGVQKNVDKDHRKREPEPWNGYKKEVDNPAEEIKNSLHSLPCSHSFVIYQLFSALRIESFNYFIGIVFNLRLNTSKWLVQITIVYFVFILLEKVWLFIVGLMDEVIFISPALIRSLVDISNS